MKKALLISAIQIFPPESGGQLRTANLCLGLNQEQYKVELYSLTGRKKDYLENRPSEENKLNSLLSEYVNRNKLLAFFQWTSYKLKLPPFWVTFISLFFTDSVLKNKIANSDLIILDFPFLYPFLNRQLLKNKRTILNTHNAEFNLYQNQLLSKMVKKIELNAFSKASQIVFCNQKDQEIFENEIPNIPQKSMIISNGINLSDYEKTKLDYLELRKKYQINENLKVFLFTGSNYAPNAEALSLIREMVKKHSQDLIAHNICIVIAGTVTTEKINQKELKIFGKVDSIIDFMKLADFALNPMVSGSGTNVKMFEYLASRLPIISTTFGTRGLKLIENESYLNCDQDLYQAILSASKIDAIKSIEISNLAYNNNKEILTMNQSIKTLLENYHETN